MNELTLSGGEVSLQRAVSHGSYRTLLKAPNAANSLTGFFLYAQPDFEREVDVEIFNDKTGRIMFTTYAYGEKTNHKLVEVGKDLTNAYYD